jgi:hypothetical protein
MAATMDAQRADTKAVSWVVTTAVGSVAGMVASMAGEKDVVH